MNFRTLNKCLQYTFLIGCAGWVLGSVAVPVQMPYAPGRLEFMLIILSVGLPSTMCAGELLHPKDKKMHKAMLFFSLIVSGLIAGAGLVAAKPLLTASGLVALAATALFFFVSNFLKPARPKARA